MAELVKLEPADPSTAVVAELEGLLARAREGEFSSFAFALIDREARTHTGWTAAPVWASLAGAIGRLQWRYHSEKEDEALAPDPLRG